MDRLDLDNWTAKEVARLLTLVENDRRYYQEILTTLPIAVAVVTRELNMVLVNRAFRALFRMKHDDLDRRLDELLTSAAVKERIPKLLDSNTPENGIPVMCTDAHGVDRPCKLSVIPLWDPYDDGPSEALIAISESDQAASPAGAILDELGAVAWRADVQTGELQFGNRAAARLLGSGSTWANRVHPEDASRVAWVYEAALESGQEAKVEYRAQMASGATTWLADRIVPVLQNQRVIALNILTSDEAAQRERARRLVHMREMEAAMRLAQQVAHDFNNLWMIVNGYAEVVADRLGSSDPESRSGLEAIQKAAERGIASTSQLLLFGRPPAAHLQPLDLHGLLTKAQLPADLRLMEGLAPVSLDPSKFENALRGILEFIKGRSESSVQPVIESGFTTLISDLADGLPRGKFVTLRIGPVEKLSPRLVAHWCDPYFSESGKTAPIGMALIYSQLRQMGVWMRLDRVEDERGVLILELPLARLPEPPKPEPPVVATEPEKKVQQLETVLVVDDEESIRSLVSRVLTKRGYVVIEAGNSEDAIRLSDEHPDPIPLVISDIILPGMRGPEMVKQLRHSRPDLRVLYISGYTDDDEIASGVLAAGEGFLQKPFSLQSLVQTVRAVLDAARD